MIEQPARPTIYLHTIEQWFAQPQEVRSVLVNHIRLKERLWTFLKEKIVAPMRRNSEWVPCAMCRDSEHPGYVLLEPRHPGIHPSQFGQPCLLKIWKEMRGEEKRERHEPRSQLIFDFGSALHHLFQGYGEMGAWGPHYSKESVLSGEFQELSKALMIEGSADAENIIVIDDIPNSPIYEVGVVHEYKSKKQELFQKLTKPDPAHRVQAMIYGAALNRPLIVFLYMNKNDSDLKDFVVQFNPDEWESIRSKAALLMEHHRNNSPPQGTTGYHCNDCGYQHACEAYRATLRPRS